MQYGNTFSAAAVSSAGIVATTTNWTWAGAIAVVVLVTAAALMTAKRLRRRSG